MENIVSEQSHIAIPGSRIKVKKLHNGEGSYNVTRKGQQYFAIKMSRFRREPLARLSRYRKYKWFWLFSTLVFIHRFPVMRPFSSHFIVTFYKHIYAYTENIQTNIKIHDVYI